MAKSKEFRTGVTDFYAAKATYDEQAGTLEYGTPRVIGGTASVGVSHNKGEPAASPARN